MIVVSRGDRRNTFSVLMDKKRAKFVDFFTIIWYNYYDMLQVCNIISKNKISVWFSYSYNRLILKW